MALVQILAIWGALSGALFPSPVVAGEWDDYQALKQAMVRSSSKRDIPLPKWITSLDYQRPAHFWDLTPSPKKEPVHVVTPSLPVPLPDSK